MEVITTAIVENLVSIIMATLSGVGGLMIYLLVRKLNPDVAEKAIIKAFNKHTAKYCKYRDKAETEKEKAKEIESKVKDKSRENVNSIRLNEEPAERIYTQEQVKEIIRKIKGE